MALINLTLQGKGGVGKSFVASLLAQYYQGRGGALACYDTDPVNQSFGGYTAFGVERVQLGERVDEINPRSFDALLEKLVTAPADATVVIDNGAATFLPLLAYMVENEALGLIQGAGHEVRIHSVVTGGQAMTDTLEGLASVLQYCPTVPVVVWLNEYFGRVERVSGGKVQTFEDAALYKKNAERILAMVRLPQVRKETFGLDIEMMLRRHLSFDQAAQDPEFTIMSRQRLSMTWRSIRAAMELAQL
ncbi:conjugal transfer protein TraL [Caenispirillum bisanense]|uniref:CobQ/CobB/MinD/ParA nucleotide binding domain-containing protein n=1 Tax=Caenispirillum bisanense TaxID=414052 RepID=A0A286GSV7_9PROT|nr:conjugal transfer protein TraL [Caenispirillum bisanense]SOD98618.1 hypothetical protein SAMN05421508_10828 [Caenispirillum bisanense]